MTGARPAPAAAAATTGPIRHVVVIYEENHSFDNVLGRLCKLVSDGSIVRPGAGDACDGAMSGLIAGGTGIKLTKASDVVPRVGHAVAAQQAAIDGGKMDGFSRVFGCTAFTGYACYRQFVPAQIPNIASLAEHFTIADATFEDYTEESWTAHLELVAATRDGFEGNNPQPPAGTKPVPGWGCDSHKTVLWQRSSTSPFQTVPSCVPTKAHTGAFEPTPVPWVPTIMDRLDAAGRTWRLFTVSGGSGYGWAICPSFAECLDGPQHADQVANTTFATDAADGTLPNFSVLLPGAANSQHNSFSMREGDNWIGRAVQAVENGPDWPSTAIFITWDDCGCFYDHVPPPTGLGIRVPMIIVSPYAKPGYTDSHTASFNSLLAFTEHTFGLKPLGATDASAYDYSNSFNYNQTPLHGVAMRNNPISANEQHYILTHSAGRSGGT
jgi:phospholipase C